MPTSSMRGPWFTVLCMLLFGLFLIRNGSADPVGAPPQPTAVTASPRPDPATRPRPHAPAPLPHTAPLRIRIPDAAVDAPLTKVGLDPDGWITAPPQRDGNVAGWYSGSVGPGERGTSVVVGHVDNKAGPAVFYALGALKRNARVEVRRGDGRTALFAVYAVKMFAQKSFPADQVYADTDAAELRLITCGGDYTKESGYEANVVAYARLTAIR
ncbi:class F sortase [Streptomyces sp. NPDC002889]|uniref:class F sortase n=1 Tax=Streptomyces sp. NPDC002889 TaxID=3364669 RepID=UPI0036A20A7C